MCLPLSHPVMTRFFSRSSVRMPGVCVSCHCESHLIHIPLSPRAVFLQRRSSELMDNEELTVGH